MADFSKQWADIYDSEFPWDFDIEVEYQSNTIGKYDLEFNGKTFILKNKTTACLAQDACGIPSEKEKKNLSELNVNQNNS